jgi:hypothetical protein
VQDNGRILLRLSLQYDLGRGPVEKETQEGAAVHGPVFVNPVERSSVNESVAVVLDAGKPMTVTQSADPLTDRKVTVEVKATILK